jgi:hypothetical protein
MGPPKVGTMRTAKHHPQVGWLFLEPRDYSRSMDRLLLERDRLDDINHSGPAPGYLEWVWGEELAAMAQQPDGASAISTRLAYIVTGDAQVDEVSRLGLVGLSDFVNRRTAAALAEPAAVVPGRDRQPAAAADTRRRTRRRADTHTGRRPRLHVTRRRPLARHLAHRLPSPRRRRQVVDR